MPLLHRVSPMTMFYARMPLQQPEATAANPQQCVLVQVYASEMVYGFPVAPTRGPGCPD